MDRLDFLTKPADYSRCGFKGNPFPRSGIPGDSPSVYCGHVEVLKAIGRTIRVPLDYGGSCHMVLIGSYGSGKTHTLKYVRCLTNQYEPGTDGIHPLAIYLAQPGEKIIDFYKQFMSEIGFEFIKILSRNYIAKIVTQQSKNDDTKPQIKLNDGWEQIESGKVLLSDIINIALKDLTIKFGYPDYAKAFLDLAFESQSTGAWEWISGEGLDYLKRQNLGVIRNIDERSAIKAFGCIKSILNDLGYSPIVLMVDEFESIGVLNAQARQKALNNMRRIIDNNANGLTMIFACTPDAWAMIASEYHAFGDRISTIEILKPFDRVGIEVLIKAYIAEVNHGSVEIPFSQETIERILTDSGGNVRKIVMLCGQYIDNGGIITG